MAYDFTLLEKQAKGAAEWLQKNLASVRTGRANPALLDGCIVQYAGAKLLLKQLAAIQVEDARTLRVQPWDPGSIGAIEQAIRSSELGVQPIVDKETIRIILPELTQERRGQLHKLVRDKLEDARKTLRGHRDNVWHDIQEKVRKSELTEDDKYMLKDTLEKLIEGAHAALERIAKKKDEELNF